MEVINVNGSLLKKMVINGAINLKNNYQEIDRLNVFPVPDGDTGTNMQMTMMAGVKEISNLETNSVTEVAKKLSRGLLMGARGNSGVILSQYFRGLFIGTEKIKGSEATVAEFIDCLVSGYEVAYKAVMEPVEGTILTVVREAAQFVEKNKGQYKTINEVLDAYVKQANISLENTPNLLPVLKEAGVVDSGGAGFVKVIDGMIMAMNGEMLEYDNSKNTNTNEVMSLDGVDIKFGYCTEFILQLKNENDFSESDLKGPLSLLGDSLVVVQDEDLVKIHVHTNEPGKALNLAQKYGEFKTLKIENMREQHSNLVDIAPKPKKKQAIIAVCFGDGVKETFSGLGVDYIIDGGQTMNPPTEEFVKAVEAVNAESVIIIPNNSNVILSAEQAAKICTDVEIHVLKAKTIPHGYASLMVFDPSAEAKANFNEMQDAVKNVNSGEVTFAVRDTEINNIKITSGDFIGIVNGQIISSFAKRVDTSKAVLDASINADSQIATIFAGKDSCEDELELLEKHCYALNKDIEVEVIEGNQDIYSYIIAVE
ncbi:MAG: DAK2 domain-containing protein [bacterium]